MAEFQKSIRGYLFSMTLDAHLAEDLVQETFCKAWIYREQYVEQGTPGAYLFRIADRILKDYHRKKREMLCDDETWAGLAQQDHAAFPDEKLQQQEEFLRLQETLRLLTPIQQHVLTLRYFSQLKFSEIARIVEMPLNTVLSHVHRGLEELRKRMVFQEDGQVK
ncbi:MAG: RNA polymerase sigma factor [Planctomycetia bacterium]|nr:RNA polymerase sigma factor [Planctomycetia bacterium]